MQQWMQSSMNTVTRDSPNLAKNRSYDIADTADVDSPELPQTARGKEKRNDPLRRGKASAGPDNLQQKESDCRPLRRPRGLFEATADSRRAEGTVLAGHWLRADSEDSSRRPSREGGGVEGLRGVQGETGGWSGAAAESLDPLLQPPHHHFLHPPTRKGGPAALLLPDVDPRVGPRTGSEFTSPTTSTSTDSKN